MDVARQDQAGSDKSPQPGTKQPMRPALKRTGPGQHSFDSSRQKSSSIGQATKKGGKSSSLLHFLSVKEPSRDALAHYAEQQKKEAAVKGKAVINGGPSARKLPTHVPKVNSKWDGLPHGSAHSSKDGSTRSNRSQDSSRSTSTATSTRHKVKDTRSPLHHIASSASSGTAPGTPPTDNYHEHQHSVSESSARSLASTIITPPIRVEPDKPSPDHDEPRVVSQMLSSLDVPVLSPDSSEDTDDALSADNFLEYGYDDILQLTMNSKHQVSDASRPVQLSGSLGEISACPMPTRFKRESADSSGSATPPSIPRKVTAVRQALPRSYYPFATSAGTDAPRRVSSYRRSMEETIPFSAWPMPPASNRTSTSSAMQLDASPPPISRKPAVQLEEPFKEPLRIKGKATTWGETPASSSSGPPKIEAVVESASQPEKAPRIRAQSRSQSRSSGNEVDDYHQSDVPQATARPVTPTNGPRSYSVPRGLAVRAKSVSPARNFARPFSPTNPPPSPGSGRSSPSTPSPKARLGRSPGRALSQGRMAVHAITDNSLPTIPESDAGSIRSIYLHKGTDNEEVNQRPSALESTVASEGSVHSKNHRSLAGPVRYD